MCKDLIMSKELIFENLRDRIGLETANRANDLISSLEETILKQNEQIAEFQNLAKRTLLILEDEKFFETAVDEDGYGHSSLYRDLNKAANGDELKDIVSFYKYLIEKLKGEKK